MKTRYYEAIPTANGYRARIYQYKDDGNQTEVVWLSTTEYSTKEEALDAASDWADEHGINKLELG
jgi:hypothetical protein